MLISGNTAYATTNSSQQGFLGALTGKHLLRKQNVSEKNQKPFLFLGKKMFPQQMFRSHAHRETFRETCFLNNVSATCNVSSFAGALKFRHRKKRCYCLFTSCTVYLWILEKWKTDSAVSFPTTLTVLVDFSLTTTSQNHMIIVISRGAKQRQIKSS